MRICIWRAWTTYLHRFKFAPAICSETLPTRSMNAVSQPVALCWPTAELALSFANDLHHNAAVHAERLSGDITRLRGSQKCYGVRDIFRRPSFSKWNLGMQRLFDFV